MRIYLRIKNIIDFIISGTFKWLDHMKEHNLNHSWIDINKINREDKKVYSLFVDVKRSTQFLMEYQNGFMFNSNDVQDDSDSDDSDDENDE